METMIRKNIALLLTMLLCMGVLTAIVLAGSEHRTTQDVDRNGCIVNYMGTAWSPHERVISTICPSIKS